MNDFTGQAERWYESKLGFLAIVFFPILAGTVAVVLYIGQIQTTLAVQSQEFTDFKNNDITHIELEITQEQQSQTDQEKLLQQDNNDLIQIMTKLNINPLIK